MGELAREKRTFSRFEEARMPVEDIFVHVVGKSKTPDEGGSEAQPKEAHA